MWIDSYFYLIFTTDLLLNQLIFVRKPSIHFLKLFHKIFNYFSKIKFSEFRKKEIFPVVIFVLDLFKTSVQGTPGNQVLSLNIFAKSSIVNVRLGFEYTSELSIKYFFSSYNDRSMDVLNQKTNIFFDE